MIRQSARFLLTCAYILALSLLTTACETPSDQPVTQSGTPAPRVIIQGESDQEVLQQPPIQINNCDGKAEAIRTEKRSQTISATVSEQIALALGVSAELISAEVQAAVSVALTDGLERSTEITLSAPPRTHMIFQLAWLGKEQLGIAENVHGWTTPIAFKRFVPSDVRIKSQSDIGCPTQDGQGPSAPQPTAPTATPVQTIALSEKTPIETMDRQQLATIFGVPKDRIVRENPRKIHVFDYPLRPEYGQDEEGYIIKDGQRVASFVDKELMNFGTAEEPWKYYLGPINWRIPASTEIGFCKVGIWAAGNSSQWTSTLRYATNDDNSVLIEGAPRAWITCDKGPARTWAQEEAMRAKNDPGAVGVYYWDSNSNQWINVK